MDPENFDSVVLIIKYLTEENKFKNIADSARAYVKVSFPRNLFC